MTTFSHRMSTPTLPPELFVIIIDHLDVQTLLRCREVCKTLRDIIDNSPSFQYKIELAVAGMDDGPPSDFGPAERLRILNAHQTAWKQLSWKELHVPIPLPVERAELWACSGNVLAMGCHRHLDFLITLIQLPSVIRGIEEKTWSIVMKGIRSVCRFEIDPSQDLIVIVNFVLHEDHNIYRHVYLHMLSTGERHPLSTGVLIRLEHGVSSFRESRWYGIQIIDNMVGVQCTITGQLMIWDWKTGELKMNMRQRYFSFLTKHLVMTGDPTCFALNIYDLRPSSSEEDSPSNIPLLCTFKFPRLSECGGGVTSLTDILTDLSSGTTSCYTHSAPFHTLPNDRLYAFRCRTTGRPPSMPMIFAPLSTFVAHIHNLRTGETGRSFSWEEWGAKDAHVLEFDNPHFFVRCVHGMKFSILNNNQINVYDFNRLSFRRVVSSGTSNPPRRLISNSMQPVCSSSYQIRSAPMPDMNYSLIMTEDCLIPLPDWMVLPYGCQIFSF